MAKGGGTPGETPEERALARIAAEEYGRFESTFVPLENLLIGKVTDTETFRTQALGLTGADTNLAFDAADQEVEAGLTQRGARPGSGAFAEGLGDLSIDRGRALGTGLAKTNDRVYDREAAGLDALISMGRGQASGARLGLQDVAGLANRDAILDAEAAAQVRAGYAGALGAGAGLALGANYNTPPRQPEDPTS